MNTVFGAARVRPRLVISAVTGVAAALLGPAAAGFLARALLGWNVAVWLYLLLVSIVMLRADHARVRRIALAHAEGATTVLAIVTVAAIVSLVGVVVQLAAAKGSGASHEWPHVAFALVTVIGSWLLIPFKFTQTYASAYYHREHGGGLRFPDADPAFLPHYADFLYFAVTIAVASQTADVSVVTPAMRRLVLVQSVLSFAFNAAILAFTINVAASLF